VCGESLPKVPEGKVGVYVYLDAEIHQKLMELIRKKFTKLHGALSAEVNDALAHWILEHQETLDLHTNTHKPINPSLSKSHLYARQIIGWLKDHGFFLQCSIKDLTRAISYVRGSDPRTIKKWTEFLTSNGYMKWITHRSLEIL